MKHIFSTILAVVVLSTVFTACKKDHKRISEVKTVPTVTINGDKFISIPVGGTYTDAGATFVAESGTSSTITPDSGGTVDVNTPGLYVLTYSRTTESQFNASDARYVAVTNIPDNVDISGDYVRTTGIDNPITKVARGLYQSGNFGGSTLVVTAYFAQLDSNTIVAPPQPTSDGITSGEDMTITYNSDGSTTLAYIVNSSSFGASVRTFIKQP